jgi:hypothetical protein
MEEIFENKMRKLNLTLNLKYIRSNLPFCPSFSNIRSIEYQVYFLGHMSILKSQILHKNNSIITNNKLIQRIAETNKYSFASFYILNMRLTAKQFWRLIAAQRKTTVIEYAN